MERYYAEVIDSANEAMSIRAQYMPNQQFRASALWLEQPRIRHFYCRVIGGKGRQRTI